MGENASEGVRIGASAVGEVMIRKRLFQALQFLAHQVVYPEWNDIGCGDPEHCPMEPPTVPWWRKPYGRNNLQW